MSTISINFGSSPEEIHFVGDLAPELWDLIYTYKSEAEWRDRAEIPDWWISKIAVMSSKELKKACKTHRVRMTWWWRNSVHLCDKKFGRQYNPCASYAPLRIGMVVNILFKMILESQPEEFHPMHILDKDYKEFKRHPVNRRRYGEHPDPIDALNLYSKITQYIHHNLRKKNGYGNLWEGKYACVLVERHTVEAKKKSNK